MKTWLGEFIKKRSIGIHHKFVRDDLDDWEKLLCKDFRWVRAHFALNLTYRLLLFQQQREGANEEAG